MGALDNNSLCVLIVCLALFKRAHSAAVDHPNINADAVVQHFTKFGQALPANQFASLCGNTKAVDPPNLCKGGIDNPKNTHCSFLCTFLGFSYKLCLKVELDQNHITYDVCGCTDSTANYRTGMKQWFWFTGNAVANTPALDGRQSCGGLSVFFTK